VILQSYVEAISPDSEDPGPDDGTDPNYVQKAIVPQVEFALVRHPRTPSLDWSLLLAFT
jgi:hypothetical protein